MYVSGAVEGKLHRVQTSAATDIQAPLMRPQRHRLVGVGVSHPIDVPSSAKATTHSSARPAAAIQFVAF